MKQTKEKAPRTAATVQGAKDNTHIQFIPELRNCQAEEIPGLTFLGYIAGRQTGGVPVPLYEPREPEAGRPSINTLEGWNLLRWETAEGEAKRKFGRNPTAEEVQDVLDSWKTLTEKTDDDTPDLPEWTI